MELVAEATRILADLRDNYASTLDDPAGARYEREFNRAARRRLPRFALELED